jgi:hypothetical protein
MAAKNLTGHSMGRAEKIPSWLAALNCAPQDFHVGLDFF